MLGTPAHRVDAAEAIRPEWLEAADVVGVTGSAEYLDGGLNR